MGTPFPSNAVGGTTLLAPAIQSPDFSESGKTGWAILQNGDAYFYSLTAEGSITTTQVIAAGSGGVYTYSSTPAAGNLVSTDLPAVPEGGTDPYGNAIPSAGQTTYYVTAGTAYAITTYGGSVSWYTATSQAGPYTQAASLGLLNPSGPGTLITSTAGIASGLAVDDVAVGEWQQATLETGWAGSGSGVDGLWWRLLAAPANTLEIIADITGADITGNSVCAVLPDAVAPATPSNQPAGWNVTSDSPSSYPWVYVSEASESCHVQVTGIQAEDVEIFFHIFVPLDTL